MNICSVCGTANDDLAVTCTNCRGYLQARVDTLDLFATAWGLIESPRLTMRRIVLSRYKNYVSVLSGFAGVAIMSCVLWLRKSADADNAAQVLVGGLAAGIPLGIIMMFPMALLTRLFGGRQGRRRSLRDVYAMLAYSMVPVVMLFLLSLPVKIAVFGADYFGSNPHPLLLQPDAYLILVALDALSGAWSLLLVAVGSTVLFGLHWLRSMVVSVLTATVVGGMLIVVSTV